MLRVTLVDYGAGNLHSLAKALAGAERVVRVAADPFDALDTDVLVLPGVGAFGAAAARLAPARDALRDAILAGLPTLGICLGMQLLFGASDEGDGRGLDVVSGRVERLRATRVPHIGWNAIDDPRDPLFAGSGLAMAYYANGYVCRPDDPGAAIAWTAHGADRFVAAVRRGACVGVQFHPEKSSVPGLRFLDAFLRETSSRIDRPSPVTS